MSITWKALYNDGTVIEQENLGYDDLDHDNLVAFGLFVQNLKLFQINLSPEDRLIWRRRHALTVNGGQETVHIIGKQWTIDGVNNQWICAYFENDGHIEFAPRFDSNLKWFAPITVHKKEKWDVENLL